MPFKASYQSSYDRTLATDASNEHIRTHLKSVKRLSLMAPPAYMLLGVMLAIILGFSNPLILLAIVLVLCVLLGTYVLMSKAVIAGMADALEERKKEVS